MLWACGASLFTLGCALLAARSSVPDMTSIPVFMLITIVVAWRAGFRASLTVAVVATLELDFFFTEPRYTLEVASPHDAFALLTFAATSTLVSRLSHRIRIKSDLLQKAEEQQRLLYEVSRSALLLDWKDAVEEQLCELIHSRFRVEGVALLTTEHLRVVSVGRAQEAEPRLRAALRTQQSYDLPEGAGSVRLLRYGAKTSGALLLCGAVDPVVSDSLAALVATHLERIRSMQSEVRAQSQTVSERLRAAVLDGLAHAVKTPLTTIIASSSGLREIGPLTAAQLQLADTIEGQAIYLSDVTNTLLRTAHLEVQNVRVNLQVVELSALCDSVKHELRAGQDVTRLQFPDAGEERLSADPELLKLVLVQVLENALKYGAMTTPVRLSFARVGEMVTLAVHNEGSFIPAQEHTLIFERYYRGASTEHKASGTGIGLSVALRAMEAMGGSISVESEPDTGTTFLIRLPAGSWGEAS